MSQAVAALSSPGILLPSAQSQMAQAMATASGKTTTSSSSGTSSSSSGLGSTFLNLLATELQNQDPTAPVDSTAMVGQMISLNQLDQLISINSAVGGTSTSTTSSSSSSKAAARPSAQFAQATTGTSVPAALEPASMISNPQTTLPFDPNTMMPIATVPANSTSTTGAK